MSRSATLTPPTGTQGRIRLSALVVAAALLLIVGIWAGVLSLLAAQRAEVLATEQRQNASLTRVLAEQTLRVFATADQATRRVAEAVRNGEQPELVSIANETGLAPKILVQLSLVAPSGRFLGSNLDPDGSRAGNPDLSKREHIQPHMPPPVGRPLEADPDQLFIGKPVLGKVSGRWTIQLTRRVIGKDGQVAAILVASLDPSYFEQVYQGVTMGQQGSVSLVGRDLVVRARVTGGKPVGMGETIATGSPLGNPDLPAEGSYTRQSGLDQVERLFAYRRVADYPLYVVVGSATDEALATWYRDRQLVLTLALIATVVLAVGAVGFGMGLRRLEASHEALRISEAKAQSANRAKSEFLAAISHELRTPLTSILGFSELMEKRLEEPRFREQAGLIRKGAEHLNALLGEILDLAKVEAGAMAVHVSPQPVRPLVQGAAELFTVSTAAKGLRMAVAVDAAVPELAALDGLRVKQIINNLLSNAVKFTDEGGVRLEVALGDALDGGGAPRLLFHVRDTGPGIPPEKQELIFERFRQADDRVSYQHGGTGLGLALSRGLAELMGGTLTVASVPGQGACFTLALPLARG
jgi:signal transduction histidine kinase